jgi:lipoprotein-releasing system ATP-binding protein
MSMPFTALTGAKPIGTVREPMAATLAPTSEISTASKGGAHLRVNDLWKVFDHGGRRIEVLRGIDMDLQAGALVSIVGASGVGKSTLLHLLGTLDVPTRGSIAFDGVDVTSLSGARLADFRNQSIGFIFQFHHLLPEFTALENVMMPGLIARMPRKLASEKAESMLVRVGLAERLQHRPGELSGGEQQRVALARALMLSPRLLLGDEPTGNLDTKTGQAMHDLFFELNRELGMTLLLVTHNNELAGRAYRKLRMVDGQLVEET